jgi:hypothetical protein
LNHTFKQEISSRPDSLFQLDLGYLLDQYTDVLHELRSAFDADATPTTNAECAKGQSSAARLSRALQEGDDLDFDLSLTAIPLGSSGNKATYWVHPDHVVEVQVLLLQHMRLYISNARRNASVNGTPHRRSSLAINVDPYFGNEDATGLVVLDHPEAFAIKQNSGTIGSIEEAQGTVGTKAAGQVRCCASEQAAVLVCIDTNTPAIVKTAKMERGCLRSYLDLDAKHESKKHVGQTNGSAQDDIFTVQQWLTEHKSTRPIAGAVSKRTRFVGLHNTSTGGLWASLDKDVFMKSTLHKDLESDGWASAARSDANKFPHAILEVRLEGNHAMSLIHSLDRSHLV